MKCQCIMPFSTKDGEILLGHLRAYFFDMSQPFKPSAGGKSEEGGGGRGGRKRRGPWGGNKSIVWLYEEIREIHRRRYLLKNTALELFSTTGRTSLLTFAQESDREQVYSTVTTSCY